MARDRIFIIGSPGVSFESCGYWNKQTGECVGGVRGRGGTVLVVPTMAAAIAENGVVKLYCRASNGHDLGRVQTGCDFKC